MAKTALTFYRKNQSIANLETERPKSIASFRGIIRAATEDIENRLSDVEKLFYGGRRGEDALRDLVPSVRRAMRALGVSSFQASWQVSYVNNQLKDPDNQEKIDASDITTINQIHKMILEFIPGRLKPLMNDIQKVLENLRKYCLSFSPKYVDKYMETVSHYEMKIQEFSKAIELQLDNIAKLINTYTDKGALAKYFGIHTNDMARRCDCASMPFLLIFPEACANVRNACAAAMKWLQEEEMYPAFLKIDIAELDRKKDYQMKVVRESQKKMSHIEHRIKMTRRDICESTQGMQKTESREESILSEINKLERDITDAQYALEFQESLRDGHRRKTDESTEDRDKFEAIIKEILSLRDKIAVLKRQIEAAKAKRDWIAERKKRIINLQKQMLDLENDLKEANRQRKLDEAELKNITGCLEHIKRIYLYKTSPDAMKKIFYHMPVENRNARLHKTKPAPDHLEKMSKFVAKRIERDWMKLYRHLPFYPPRGDSNIQSDIDEIAQQQYRSTVDVRARKALQRWRRLNVRASTTELRQALIDCNRKDIVEALDSISNTKSKPRTKPTQATKTKRKILWNLPRLVVSKAS